MILPTLPERISRLNDLIKNLWWSWDPNGRELFRVLDTALWHSSRHNPIEMLSLVPQETLLKAANDPSFLKLYDKTLKLFDDYMDITNKWYYNYVDQNMDNKIAYFSFEFGIHQSMPIYSGGLGVLSGDTCKEASDLGIPFVAIGFYYFQGYFEQTITPDGWQRADFNTINSEFLPMERVLDANEEPIILSVRVKEDTIHAQVWKANVGTVELYLLDTDIDDNKPWYRGLSSRLYGGDQETRINQELVLGIGGVKLLKELGIKPVVWHLNEGHCSFLSIERIADAMKNGMSFEEAHRYVKLTTVFTTHTPVPAGHDRFNIEMVDQKLKHKWEELGVSRDKFLNLGINRFENETEFNMTILGFNTAHLVNGVSKLHTDVSKEMFKEVLEERKEDTTLIAITNGIHLPTFISGPMRRVFDKYVDPNWINKQDKDIWEKVMDIPDQEFWKARTQSKERLMAFIRETARDYRLRGVMGAEQILASGTFLDPHALTIGFARRFATYKRAPLLFSDLNRIRDAINNPHKPIQFVFAGKAHPADEQGKHLIQQVYRQASAEANGGRVAFLENYDLHIARFLVQGVDVWLNNPIRPHEASGTSGMKAAMNGIPHFSVLDGWWAEGYNGSNGWVIGEGLEFEDQDQQDDHDVNSLYDLLEKEIVPLYYEKDSDEIPRKWIKICKESIKTTAAQFNMTRMIKDYVHKMYKPSIENYQQLQ